MARMTPPKSPMPKSPMSKSPMVCEKYDTGCMWRVYGLFNFRQGHSNKKLLSHRRRLHRLDDGNFKSKIDLHTNMDEKSARIDDRINNKTRTNDSDMVSKRKLKGEKLSTELQMSKKIATDEVKDMQSNSEFVGYLPKNNGKASKTAQRSDDIPDGLKNGTKHRKPSNSVSEEKSSNKLNSAAVQEVFMKEAHSENQRECGCESINSLKHDQLNEINLLPVQMNAAEATINQKFVDGVNHQSKQLSQALEVLNSNKELFIKLLQDPNSLLVKHIEDLRGSQARKHQSKVRQFEGPSDIHQLKPYDTYPSQESDLSKFSERIVVLKPSPPSIQVSADSMNTVRHLSNNRQSETTANFSFSRMKRKLRHAIGVSRKEQHSESIDGPQHASPCQGSENDCKGKGVETLRRNPPTTPVDSGGLIKSSFSIKKRDNISQVKESSIGCEAASTSGRGLGSSQHEGSEALVEARKHLSELSDNKNYFERQAQKTQGRVMSFPEYDFLPTRSPGRDWEYRFVNERMRFSPYSNCHLVCKNKWGLQEGQKTSYSSPLWQDVEALLYNRKFDDLLQVFDAQPSISDYPSIHIKKQGDNSRPTESNKTMHRGETYSSDVPSEWESTDKITTIEARVTICPNSLEVLSKPDCKENTCTTETNDATYQGKTDPLKLLSELDCTDTALYQITEITKMSEEEEYFKISRLDQPLTSSPYISPSTPPSIQRVEGSNCTVDKGEQPSPVSVLDQSLVDATSPASTISEPRKPSSGNTIFLSFFPYSPHVTELNHACISEAEEHHSAHLLRSASGLVTSSLDEHEFISEYVRAVLEASSLNWEELSMRCHSSNQLLDPFLFDAVKLQGNQFRGDCMLLFDCINEVLVEVYLVHLPCSPWVSFVKPNIRRQLSIEKTVIHEVLKYVDLHLLSHSSPRTLQQLVNEDISESATWLDVRKDTEDVVFEMVEGVLEELIMETIF